MGAGAPDWVSQGTQMSETMSTGKCHLPHQDFSHILVGRASLTCWCQAWPRAGTTAENQVGTGLASAARWARTVSSNKSRAPCLAQPWQVQRPRTAPVGLRVGVPEPHAVHHSPGWKHPTCTQRAGQDVTGRKAGARTPREALG